MKNYAGVVDADDAIAAELSEAGIEVVKLPEFTRDRHPEMRTIVMGTLYGWSFKRAWCYWIADGPGIPMSYAQPFYDECGTEARVAGDCACRPPLFWYRGLSVGSYHVDSQNALNKLAALISRVVHDHGGDKEQTNDSGTGGTV